MTAAAGASLWLRPDWPDDVVGSVHQMVVSSQISQIPGVEQPLVWKHIAIKRLDLERRAALQVLQGVRLDDLLAVPGSAADFVIGCREWVPYGAPPALLGLQLARLNVVPDGVSRQEILAVLADFSRNY